MVSNLKSESITCFFTPNSAHLWPNVLLSKTILNVLFFFYQGFLSLTRTTHRTAGEGRGPSFIPLYHFHPLTNLRHLFATFHVRWLSRIFNRNACVYQTATRWDLPPYRITIWLIDDVILIFVWLLVELIVGCVTAIWHEKPVDSNSHQLSSLYYKRTD